MGATRRPTPHLRSRHARWSSIRVSVFERSGGIQNSSDFQVAKDWVDTYSAPSLQVPWYNVLGNHEYGCVLLSAAPRRFCRPLRLAPVLRPPASVPEAAPSRSTVSSPLWLLCFHPKTHQSGHTIPFATRGKCCGARYNASAQIDIHDTHPNWIMDDRYYSRRVELGSSGHHLTMIFIDSSPCITEYRSESKEGWDPCGTEYPTCSLSGGGDEFEGPCQFHDNIIAQDCGAQLAWFKKTLAAAPKDDWLFVVGHHPADELDVEDFTTAMQQHGFDLYLNGHVHTLTQYQLDGGGAYVTSGAGALVMSHDQLGGTPAKDRTYRKANSVELELLADASAAPSGHSYKQVFNAKVSGFTLHTFSDDYTQLSTVFLDTHGKTLHSFTVNKGGSPAPEAAACQAKL